jgi:carboxypeptidase PM20D1
VLEHVRRVVGDDASRCGWAAVSRGVHDLQPDSGPSASSRQSGVAPDAIVAPSFVVVTDARHYAGLGGKVLRFLPLRLTSSDVERIHGTDERLATDSYADAIRIYRQLVLEAAGPSASGDG